MEFGRFGLWVEEVQIFRSGAPGMVVNSSVKENLHLQDQGSHIKKMYSEHTGFTSLIINIGTVQYVNSLLDLTHLYRLL